MLVKTAIDIKNEYSNSSISSSNEDSSKEQNDYEGVESDYKRPEFWIIHPVGLSGNECFDIRINLLTPSSVAKSS